MVVVAGDGDLAAVNAVASDAADAAANAAAASAAANAAAARAAADAVAARAAASAALAGAALGDTGQNVARSDPPKQPESESMLKLAYRAYDEVLDATKHQDDKVGRFLTAIAFLTTGAIALLAEGNSFDQDYSVLTQSSNPLLAWSTGLFFVFTLGAVVLLLLCLSVPIRLPKSSRDPMKESHLFYSYIAARPFNVWAAEWKRGKVRALESEMAQDYVRESHNLAERVSAKYRHSYEASWLFVCGLLFLGVSIFLRMVAVVDSGDTVDLDRFDLIFLAAIVSGHAALQVYTRAVHDNRSMEKVHDRAYNRAMKRAGGEAAKLAEPAGKNNSAGAAGDKSAISTSVRQTRGARRRERRRERVLSNAAQQDQRRNTMWSLLAPVGFSFAVALSWGWVPGQVPHAEQSVPAGMAAVTSLIGLLAVRDRWDDTSSKRTKLLQLRHWKPVAVAIAAGGCAWSAAYLDGTWRAAAIPLPALAFGIYNAARPAMSQRKTRRLQVKAGRDRAARRIATLNANL